MTPEMAFECLLVSHDPTVFCTMRQILRDFSIYTNVCSNPSQVANLLVGGSVDLIVIDLECESSSELMQRIFEVSLRQKPTILAVSPTDAVVPGVHVILQKPVTPESGVKSLRAAYSRMLGDYRKHTRFALMTPILATDENNRQISATVTNIGEGGVGLTTQNQPGIGSILSFRVPLAGRGTAIHIQARVLWTRPYGAVGCEFIRISSGDLLVLHTWLEGKYRIKKPLVAV
jgi:hypothetical protein